jgi:hypothetical protein
VVVAISHLQTQHLEVEAIFVAVAVAMVAAVVVVVAATMAVAMEHPSNNAKVAATTTRPCVRSVEKATMKL